MMRVICHYWQSKAFRPISSLIRMAPHINPELQNNPILFQRDAECTCKVLQTGNNMKNFAGISATSWWWTVVWSERVRFVDLWTDPIFLLRRWNRTINGWCSCVWVRRMREYSSHTVQFTWPICGWKQTKLVWILAANSSAKHSPRHIMCAAQNGSIFSRSCSIQSRRLVNMMQDWWLIGIEKDKKLQIEESNWMNGNGMVANMRHSWVHLMAFLGLDWARIEIWWFDFLSVCWYGYELWRRYAKPSPKMASKFTYKKCWVLQLECVKSITALE